MKVNADPGSHRVHGLWFFVQTFLALPEVIAPIRFLSCHPPPQQANS